MENMSETTVVVNTGLDTPNGLGVDWIANNIYWTDNDFKVHFNFVEKEYYKYVISVLKNLNNFEIQWSQVVEVAKLDGSSRKTLISELTEPRALALFPAKG